MNFFKDKINRARLLDLTVVNTLHKKSKFYDRFKKFFKTEEEFDNFFKKDDDMFIKFIEYIKSINSQKNTDIIRNADVYINYNDLPEKFKKNIKIKAKIKILLMKNYFK